MKTPGQNFAFATKSGDIAMRTQGEWPAKWKGQGDFIMPGTDSSYIWQAMIPFNETPFQYTRREVLSAVLTNSLQIQPTLIIWVGVLAIMFFAPVSSTETFGQ